MKIPKSSQKIGLYPGSFDPMTVGHLWTIKEASKLFDRLIVAVGLNPDKKGFLSLTDRIEILEDAVSDMPNVEIGSYSGSYLVSYANEVGATHIVRGLRNEADLAGELLVQRVGEGIAKDLGLRVPSAVFLSPPAELSGVSSSVVRGLLGYQGWEVAVKRYLTEEGVARIQDKIQKPDPYKAIPRESSLAHRMQRALLPTGLLRYFAKPIPSKDLAARYAVDIEEFANHFHKLYSQPGRAYHRLKHIVLCLEQLALIIERRKKDKPLPNPKELAAALLYHDAVYVVGAKDNEERSAELACRELAGISSLGEKINTEYVARLIRLTALHGGNLPSDLTDEEKTFLDIDTSILAGNAEEYQWYSDGVRREYEPLAGKSRYADGRIQFLTAMLKTERIFLSEEYRDKEADARRNISEEISRLTEEKNNP